MRYIVIMSSDTKSSNGRISDVSNSTSDSNTSFTSNEILETQSTVADRLLQIVGETSEKKVKFQRNIFKSDPQNPHLKELAKLSKYPDNEELDWQKANEEAEKQEARLSHHHEPPSHFLQGQYTQDDSAEKVGRVWVPFDPENPNIGNDTYTDTVHHKLTEQIIRKIEDQIENTRRVFETMASYAARYPTVASVDEDALKEERQAHAILALRLHGIEVCEWWEDADRWEVYFEYPDVKNASYLDRPGWTGEVAVGRRRDDSGGGPG